MRCGATRARAWWRCAPTAWAASCRASSRLRRVDPPLGPHLRLDCRRMTEAVSRAAGKLEAALARFGLEAAVARARAVDVGASTGGFTQTLLRHGAAHVVAVDVGHGQLAPALRDDARVTSMEGVDWKRLTLAEAPGPFDFFTDAGSCFSAGTHPPCLGCAMSP